MKKLLIYVLICIMGAMCAACTKGSSTANNIGDAMESTSDTLTADAETSKEQNTETEFPSETETEAPSETIVEYELNTVESLEDDGKEMSVAEAFRSTMKGKHSALELFERERMFNLGNAAGSIEDMSDEDLARINMLDYNRGGIGGGITPCAVNWYRFMCVDFDGNGTKEVLVDGLGICAVLHYAGDNVYMTNIYSKVRPDIVYENGVWETATGAFDRQFYRLYPAKGAIYRLEVAYEYVVPKDLNPDQTANRYTIMGKDVTKEEHDAYVEELIGGLTPLEWHEFTEENIDKYIVD